MKTIQWLATAAALSSSLPAFATSTPVTTTYDFATPSLVSSTTVYNPYANGGNGGYNGTVITSDFGNTVTFNSASGANPYNAQVTVSSFASTGAGSDINAKIETGIVTYYSGNGLGVTSANNGGSNYYGKQDEYFGCNAKMTSCTDNSANDPNDPNGKNSTDQHAVDNVGAYEALLLAFNSKVKLNTLTIGFPTGASPDSDATVLYYTGNGVPPVLTNYSFASLLSTGLWAIANGGTTTANDTLYNIGATAGQTATIVNPVAAQYFLVGAYIPLTGQPTNTGVSPDYIKLKSISTTQVPEPSTLALFGIAGGALFIRRRRSARAV